jgi:hypothetical protein
MADDFDTCDFYDCRDAENLTHTSPEEALDAFVDAMCVPNSPILPQLQALGDVTVTGFRPSKVDPTWVTRAQRALVEHLLEMWDEEYGHSENQTLVPVAVDALLISAAETLVGVVTTCLEPWACKAVATRTYTNDEILALMREEHPDWFAYAMAQVDV